MVFHWSLSDSKSPQVSRTLFSILTDCNNAVVLMTSTRPSIFKPSSPCINSLVTVPRAPIIIGITVTLMFHSFFNPLARSSYLYFFSFSFNFTLWSAGTAKSTILFFFFLLIITRSGRLAEIRWSVCISKTQKSLRSAKREKSTRCQVLSLLIKTKSGFLAWIGWSVCIQSPREFFAFHFQGQLLVGVYIIC